MTNYSDQNQKELRQILRKSDLKSMSRPQCPLTLILQILINLVYLYDCARPLVKSAIYMYYIQVFKASFILLWQLLLTPLMTYFHSYEAHYNSLHRHCCQNCQRSFPSTHLLEIHVLENHDTLFGMLASRKNLVNRKCSTCLLLPFDYLNLMEDIFSSTFASSNH